MGLEEVLESIKAHKEGSIAQIEREAAEQEEKILGEAKEAAKAIAKESKAKAKSDAEQLIARELSKARIEAKMIYNNAVSEKVEQGISEIKENFEEIAKSARYREILNKLANKAVKELGDDCIIVANKQDLTYLKKAAGKFSIGQPDESITAGLRAFSKDGRKEVDYTLESMIEEMHDRIASRLASYAIGNEE
ncbi:MAG: V-type ATP synthase subunit E [Candidatus Micrarchaeia archaeon]